MLDHTTYLHCLICGTGNLSLEFPLPTLRRCLACFTCTVCGMKHGTKTQIYPGTAYCLKCRNHKCGACGMKKKTVPHFSEAQVRFHGERNSHLRCIQCMICVTCRQEKDGNSFNGEAKECKACLNQMQQLTCKTCGLIQEMHDFNKDNVNHALYRSDLLICFPCRKEGYIPRDTTAYPCVLCHPKGHMRFTDIDLQAYKPAPMNQKPPLQLDVCR